ncbi:MAG: hypothetical protein HUK21_10705 [Fibrobacteraceae bacterium]|nr:hypothetical protein [Fibrobacteraceae bacterium]
MSMRKKWAGLKVFAAAIVFTAAFANAELAGMGESSNPTSQESAKSSDGLKALLGISGGNSMIADDGTIFMNLRIGLELNDFLAVGAWASTILSDVRNYNVPVKELIDYKAFGLFAELSALRMGNFHVSVPLQVGGGVVNFLDEGEEAFEPEDYFFMADMAVHFNYRVTKMLEVSIGGGYRLFAGIEENNLDAMDFCTPFGELRFTIKE